MLLDLLHSPSSRVATERIKIYPPALNYRKKLNPLSTMKIWIRESNSLSVCQRVWDSLVHLIGDVGQKSKGFVFGFMDY